MNQENIREWWSNQDPVDRIERYYEVAIAVLELLAIVGVFRHATAQVAGEYHFTPFAWAFFYAITILVIGDMVIRLKTLPRVIAKLYSGAAYEKPILSPIARDLDMALYRISTYWPALVAGLGLVGIIGVANIWILFEESGATLEVEQLRVIVKGLVVLVSSLTFIQLTIIAYVFNPLKWIVERVDSAAPESKYREMEV